MENYFGVHTVMKVYVHMLRPLQKNVTQIIKKYNLFWNDC